MKKYNSILKYIFVMFAALIITGCVHDDKYDEPNLDNYQCRSASYYTDPANGYEKWTLAQLKSQTASTAITKKAYVEAYVSSSDETGNIYKTLYVQDNPKNPTQGLTISLDAVSLYTKFPQGSKVYLDVQGLAITTYGGVKQLGKITPAGTRVPEKEVNMHVFRDCDINTRAEIVPKVMTLTDMVSLNDDLIGCLIQINNVEFDGRALCTPYAPNGVTVDKTIGEGWDAANKKYLKTAVVRNSGYASFANQTIPGGNGSLVAIYSKYNSTYQMYINRLEDVDMETHKNSAGQIDSYPRLDGVQSNPCQFSATGLTVKTIAEVKQLNTSANWTQITGDFYVKAQVTANDATGNLFKYVYIEDVTGGLRVNMNKNDLFLDNRFRLGKDVYIKLKGLYLRNVNGEIQLGGLYTPPATGQPQFGQIEEPEIYKHFFDTNTLARPVVPTERTISSLTTADVGRWVKFKDLQFIDGDLGKTYAVGTAATNRTLQDCSGNTIILRTSGQADFGSSDNPKKASATEVEGGKGDVYAIVSIFNGTYQLWITRLTDIDLDNPRCDGSVYTPLPVLYKDDFAAGGFGADWTTVNVAGTQVWNTSNQGNGTNYYAVMSAPLGSPANEDWLISKTVSLAGKTKAAVSFTTDVRYAGNALQVYATENYTGNPATTTWVALPASLDTNTAAFGDWVSSGNVDLAAFLGKNVRIAFKYTSTSSAAATWEIDDFKIKGQ